MATTEQDYYELLGVSRNASDAEIKKAFRGLARELHPDVNTELDADVRFRVIAEAYEVLSDPERRRTYDRYGHAGLRSRGFTPSDFDLGNLSDVFAAFFGDGIFGGGPRAGQQSARGADLAVAVELTLTEAMEGVERVVPIRVARACATCGGTGAAPGTQPVTCPQCAGAGRVQQVSQSVFGQIVRAATCSRCEGSGRIVESRCETCDGDGRLLREDTITVDIPAGIHDGQRIRVRGEGHDGASGAPRGDAFVHIRVAPLEGVERDGDDLHTLARLTMTQAAIGATVVVPSPQGPVELEVPPGTQPGEVRLVRGKGMPSLDGARRGDLHVHIDVLIPRRLSASQREQLLRIEEELGEEPYRHDEEGFFSRLRSAFR